MSDGFLQAYLDFRKASTQQHLDKLSDSHIKAVLKCPQPLIAFRMVVTVPPRSASVASGFRSGQL